MKANHSSVLDRNSLVGTFTDNRTRSFAGITGSSAACPLCKCGEQNVREQISVSDICRLYEKQLETSVGSIFSGVETVAFMECASCGLGYYTPTVTGDGAFYDKLQNAPWYYLKAKYEYEFVANLIGTGGSVLDVGSGEGAFSRHLPAGTSYTGLDMSGEAIRKAKLSNILVINEAVETHAVANAKRYDAVVSFQSLEHVSDPHAFISAAARCVRPSGKLVVAVPSEDSFLRYASNTPLNMPPHHVTRWSDSTLRSLAAIVGMRLSILHHEPLQDIHRDWALSVMANAVLGRGRQQIEGRAGITGRVRARLARVLSSLLRGKLPHEFQPHGHTVIAVYSN